MERRKKEGKESQIKNKKNETERCKIKLGKHFHKTKNTTHNFTYKNSRKFKKKYLDLKEERDRRGRGMGKVLDQKM